MNADLRQAVGTGPAAASVGIDERKGRFHISDFAEARLPLPDRRLPARVGLGQGRPAAPADPP